MNFIRNPGRLGSPKAGEDHFRARLFPQHFSSRQLHNNSSSKIMTLVQLTNEFLLPKELPILWLFPFLRHSEHHERCKFPA
jgi:hypothetical protein